MAMKWYKVEYPCGCTILFRMGSMETSHERLRSIHPEKRKKFKAIVRSMNCPKCNNDYKYEWIEYDQSIANEKE